MVIPLCDGRFYFAYIYYGTHGIVKNKSGRTRVLTLSHPFADAAGVT